MNLSNSIRFGKRNCRKKDVYELGVARCHVPPTVHALAVEEWVAW